MKIAVAGGTGWIGRLVVDAVVAAGDTPVVLSRSTGVDLTTGAGLPEALHDVTAVIDVSNVVTLRKRRAIAFFHASTTNLLTAGERAGVVHHVALSIVGSDRVDLGYYLGKRRQEELVLSGKVPASVLRTTQFHEFAAQMLARGGPVVLVPRQLNQPIAAREVAEALVGLARRSTPTGLAPELAGPEMHTMPDLVRGLLRARGERRLVMPVRLPGPVGEAMAGGGLLPAEPGPRGKITFAEWLGGDARTPAPAAHGRDRNAGSHNTPGSDRP
ncbi:SDR family oxidoreductase [Nonomuraea diastatica]|uniref:SDR family oxidoreductase n=1 Tax=Nonomuraea diastatica TaxID=1848329 RepID=UPI001C702747|nr:SDR family oxidoreductase [Nonomuraea diastatica]